MAVEPSKHRAQPKEILDRETPIIFTNFTDEVFYGRWNKRVYEIRAGKSVEVPFYLAEHFGKHLVDRELANKAAAELKELKKNNPNISRDDLRTAEENIRGNLNFRQELMDKCVERQQLEEGDSGVIRPREVERVQRAPLKAEQRAADLIAQGVPKDQFTHVTPRTAEDAFEGK